MPHYGSTKIHRHYLYRMYEIARSPIPKGEGKRLFCFKILQILKFYSNKAVLFCWFI